MTVRQVMLPAAAHARVAPALDALPHDIDVLLWTGDGITRPDGAAVVDPSPEAAWISVDVFFTGEFGPLADTIVGLDSVRWVQGFLAGIDAPPFQKVLGAGIRLSNSDAPNIGVAEYVLSTMLSVTHGIGDRIDAHRHRRWAQQHWPEIGGQRWVIVGFGSIGHEVAKRARPFGVEIVGIRRTPVDDPEADRMATTDNLFAELAGADAVILTCPLTEETRGLANAEFFAAMQPGAVVVNVARGAVVNDVDLLKALDDGRPGTAILDVFDPEPLPAEHPFWKHDGIVLTSHVAGAGSGMGQRNDTLFVEQLDDYLAGRPLRLEVS